MGLCSLCHRLVVGTESIHERPGLRIQEAQCRAQRRGKKKKMKHREELGKMPCWLVPYLIFLLVHQEEPAKLHNKGAAVGDRDVADHLGIVQDTAKIQLHGLKGEVGVIHLSTQVQAVYLRMLHILDG